MNREDAIKWVRHHYRGQWPTNTKSPFPNGWRWVVANQPYQLPTYKLVSSKFDEVNKSDI